MHIIPEHLRVPCEMTRNKNVWHWVLRMVRWAVPLSTAWRSKFVFYGVITTTI